MSLLNKLINKAFEKIKFTATLLQRVVRGSPRESHRDGENLEKLDEGQQLKSVININDYLFKVELR